jgi:XisI protein
VALSPALRGIETDTLTGRSPGLRHCPTRHAFPFDMNSGLRVAFVADYSCEGSGGFAPRFPSTCGVPSCQCGLSEALVCFNADCHCEDNSEPRAHDPQSAGFCKDSNFKSRHTSDWAFEHPSVSVRVFGTGHGAFTHSVVSLEIIDGKVWLQADNTDLRKAKRLEKAGIPKSDIVLGFQPLGVRSYTEYALA